MVNASGRLVPGHEAEQARRLRAEGVEVDLERGRVRAPFEAGRLLAMSIYDHQLSRLDGAPLDLHDYEDKALLIVNVASKCGLTPQYEGLEKLHEQYAEQGFSVLGVPCNQFLGQEPGSAEEIATFCSTTYGVTFPLAEKVEVNGDGRHPLFDELTAVPTPRATPATSPGTSRSGSSPPAARSPGSARRSSRRTRRSSSAIEGALPLLIRGADAGRGAPPVRLPGSPWTTPRPNSTPPRRPSTTPPSPSSACPSAS